MFLRASESFVASDWNRIVANFPSAHVLQTREWGRIKGQPGWRPLYCVWENGAETQAAALLLERSASLLPGINLRVLYAPRGPLLDWSDAAVRRQVLADLTDLVRRRGAIFVKIDPDAPLGTGIPGSPEACDDPTGQALLADLNRSGWRFSDEQIQFRNTVLLDLRPPLDDLLSRMKQKTRYNIRLAERKGVRVRPATPGEFSLLYRMYAETAARDDFVIRDESYYLTAWSTMHEAGLALPLLAEAEEQPVAAIILYHFAGKAWYMHGMSSPLHREKMPNHLLQWEAIRRLKDLGCHTYDLWGAPDVFDETDSMWGVYRFKEGLGGQVIRGLGAWDRPVRPLLYRMYTKVLPRALDIMRNRGKERTKRMVS
jgi:lipid II:glycine glycyltransferase (peptidoglycan interpeptide bridge formation enzyme)